MPFAPKRPCQQPRCNELVDSGYCEKHRALRPSVLRDQRRGNSAERGYDAKWRRFRLGFLERHPLCETRRRRCGQAATQVHHVVRLSDSGARFDEANLQGLCDRCHALLAGAGGWG